jgi:hypothetical protein
VSSDGVIRKALTHPTKDHINDRTGFKDPWPLRWDISSSEERRINGVAISMRNVEIFRVKERQIEEYK